MSLISLSNFRGETLVALNVGNVGAALDQSTIADLSVDIVKLSTEFIDSQIDLADSPPETVDAGVVEVCSFA